MDLKSCRGPKGAELDVLVVKFPEKQKDGVQAGWRGVSGEICDKMVVKGQN